MEYIKIPIICAEAILALTDSERGRLLASILAYGMGGGAEKPRGNEISLYLVLKAQMDMDYEISQKKAMAGRAGGEAKASKSKQTLAESSRIFAPLPPVPSPPISPLYIPLTPKENIPKGIQKKVPEKAYLGFDQFWDVYPKKSAKKDAFDAWKRVDPDEGLVKRILEAVKQQKLWPQYCGENARYFPSPSKWLDGGCWDDEPLAGEEDPYAKFT